MQPPVGSNIDDPFAVILTRGPCPAASAPPPPYPPPPYPPPPCPADITRSGAVDINDLFEVINAWGPCS
jgi:hypothetical protein